MKKLISIFALGLFALGMNSCSLDQDPETNLGGDQVSTPKDVEGLRNAVYQYMKYPFAGEAPMHTDYQADLFNETAGSGNRGGFFYRWELTSGDNDVLQFWYDCYIVIARANFLLAKADAVIATHPESADQINAWKGEMHLARAMMNRQLALHFCKDYEPATAASTLGVPIMSSYDLEAKPGRGTLADTYTAITQDIAAAKTLLTTEGAANSTYLNADCITAFEAQVALDMHDYPTAAAAAGSLIDLYPLVTTQEELKTMWSKDMASEIIFKVAFNKNELSSACVYTDYLQGVYNPVDPGVGIVFDYVYQPAYAPEGWVAGLYSDDDYRTGIFIDLCLMQISNQVGIGYLLTKFNGNEDLWTSPTSPNYQSHPKVFRTADMVLIKAEAQYRQGGANEALALATLNDLRTARGLDALSGISGAAIFDAIKEERVREMIGEGTRIADLKRWNDGFTRDEAVPVIGNIPLGVQGTHTMTQQAGADGFLWPIPQREFGANSNLAGQQNPGYN